MESGKTLAATELEMGRTVQTVRGLNELGIQSSSSSSRGDLCSEDSVFDSSDDSSEEN